MRRFLLKHAIALIALLVVCTSNSKAQYLKFLQGATTTNFYEIQKSVGPVLKKKYGRSLKPAMALKKRSHKEAREEEEEERENAYIHFKRWENYMAPRTYPSGDITLPSSTYERYMEYVQRTPEAQTMYYNTARMAETTADTSWYFVGPPGSNMEGRNAGRMNFITFDPSNTNIVYAGSPAGGLWKSTNGGIEWRTNTDYLSIIGCSDLAIDPGNTKILYLATGDFNGGATRSIGVLKSTDGGLTWSETGLTWDVSSSPQIARVLVSPENSQVVIVAASDGVYRSVDGGTTWIKTLSSDILFDAEFKPGDASILYACGSNFYRSADGGVTWTTITSALPTTNISRTSLAVTPANSEYVYVLYSNAEKDDFLGFYRSTDSGLNFTLRANSPNILGYNLDAGSGGQSRYDQGLTVSTVDADLVISSGVRACRSTDGGATWVAATSDCEDSNLEMHWDVHYVEFVPGSSTNAFAACDGGIYKTSNAGTCWSAINQDNVSVQQIYKFGMSATNPDIMISGHQDGATIIHNAGKYSQVLGGDGMDCFIDRTSNNVMYGSVYFGAYRRSINGGITFTDIVTGLNGQAAWLAPWQQDPIDASTLWAGYSQVFRSANRGTNWTQMGTLPNDGTIVDIHVAPSNNKVVYACRYNELFVTTNAGAAWKDITGGLPVDIAAITGLSVDDADPLHVWVTFSGYTENTKIFESTDGGTTWNNYSAGLPNLPANCIRIVPGTGSTRDELYAGCDVGVYYRNNTMSSWTPYFKDLTHSPVMDIEIYKPTSKIRVCTFGRGIWEAPLKFPLVVTGIEKERVGAFYCYPNPFVKEVAIKGKGKFSYTVYSETGTVVGKGDAEEIVKIGGNLSPGIYMIKIQNQSGSSFAKILKD